MPQSLAGVVLTDYNGRHSVALPPWRSGRCDLAKNAVNGYEETKGRKQGDILLFHWHSGAAAWIKA
jgi:hypothetical protein